MIRYISLFSGIECATVASRPLGWEPICFSEIEPFPSAVLAHHYPDVLNVGDMTAHDWSRYRGKCDVVIGGSPCQAFSVAGRRESLVDARGNLTLSFVEAVNAIDPAFVVWENVPGVLSTADNAFGCFLGALAGADSALVPPRGQRWTNAGVVAGPRRSLAWRILDAQYFGVAQRRRRVFLVGCPRISGVNPVEILFEAEGLRRHSPPRREAGKDNSGVSGTLPAGGGGLSRPAGNANELDFCVAGTVSSKWSKGTGGPSGDECQNLVAGTLTGSLGCAGPDENDAARGMYVTAFHPTQDPISSPDATHALACGSKGGQCNAAVAVAMRGRDGGAAIEVGDDIANSLRSAEGGGSKAHVLTNAVRRLAPRECERLQGLPDDYTRIPWRGKPAEECPDGPRYKAIGNGMAVPCVGWVLRRVNRAITSVSFSP